MPVTEKPEPLFRIKPDDPSPVKAQQEEPRKPEVPEQFSSASSDPPETRSGPKNATESTAPNKSESENNPAVSMRRNGRDPCGKCGNSKCGKRRY